MSAAFADAYEALERETREALWLSLFGEPRPLSRRIRVSLDYHDDHPPWPYPLGETRIYAAAPGTFADKLELLHVGPVVPHLEREERRMKSHALFDVHVNYMLDEIARLEAFTSALDPDELRTIMRLRAERLADERASR